MRKAAVCVEYQCEGCGKSCTHASVPRKFCSQQCYLSRPRPERKTGSEVACATCAKMIYLEANQLQRATKNTFCSPACHDAHQGRFKVDRVCTVCAKAFRLSPSTAKRTAGRYCSIACRSVCPVWRLNAPVAANLKQLHAKGPNRLELAGRAILAAVGVDYSEQVLIEGKFTVDVVLAGDPVVIQWDGGYWHGYRAPGDTRPLDARQAARATFDRSQDAFLRSRGYRVLRFWDHEVYETPLSVIASIKSALQ